MEKFELRGISKSIKGQQLFENVSITLESHRVYGLIGENGSGKTMLLRLMSGLIRPDSGDILVDGKKYDFMRKKPINIGLIIENIGMYPGLTGKENLEYLASINKKISSSDIRNMLEAVGLDPNDKRKVRKYSLGMRQKLVVAQCFMENPDLILLDEPTNALDEESVERVKKIVKRHAERGAVVLIVSHIKENIFSVCDQVFMLQNGRINEVAE